MYVRRLDYPKSFKQNENPKPVLKEVLSLLVVTVGDLKVTVRR